MDKYEYKVRSEEISNLINEEKYAEAVNIADTIDWRRVKSATMLLKIAALYRVNRRNEDSREILSLAYERYPANRSVVYSLCEVSIELDDVVAAIEYYKQFAKLAPKDNGVYTLRYRILEAQEASLEERIEILEELKKRDYQEEWAYELAYLYHRVGLSTKCVEECDDIILWFGDGSYVMKAMELKMLHVPLTDVQQAKYDAMQMNFDENYNGEDSATENSDAENYIEESYTDDNYTADGYDGNNYIEEGYTYEDYSDNGYDSDVTTEESYTDSDYPQETYENEDYGSDGYIDDGYTGEFYVEQTYDENGNPVQVDNNYDEFISSNASNTDDMSQYNTINLQKVVAESMKELFPDEDDDVFAEDREKYNTQEDLASYADAAGNTIVYSNNNFSDGEITPEEDDFESQIISDMNTEISDETTGDISVSDVHTGRVSQMVTGVSEATPEPHTGAISKVIIPGDDARFIKTASDMDELRDITERTVNEEHARMETNSENVYHEQSFMDMEPVIPEASRPMTGQMNINDVLEEWERMKLDNAKRHQEEIKQHVLTQTGKIFADFDNSVKSGILGELEREEDESNNIADESFLEADVTSDIPQSQIGHAAEDAFDVEYVYSDNNAALQEVGDIETEKTDEQSKEEYISTLEKVVAKELDSTQNIPAFDLSQEYEEAQSVQEAETDEDYAETQEYEADYIENGEYYENNDYAEEYSTDNYEDAEEFYDDIQVEENEEAVDEEVREEETDGLDPEDAESIAEMAMEDAMKTQEIKMNTADLSSLSEKIVETTKKEATGAKREEIREFTPEEQTLFENFAVTKKIKKQIIYALDNMTLAAYTGNIIITGDAGLDTVRMGKNLVKEYQAADANFSGKVAKITGEKINQRNLKEIFEKLNNGGIIIEKANGMSEEKLYEMASLLNQENLGIVVIMEDTKKEITKLLEKQAMIADYFNIRIDLMEMDNNALVAYAKNYALALEYSIDELGTLALYTRIANMQSGNHVVTKDEVRDIIDEAIWKSKKSKIKNFVDVLFARRYDSEDMIVLKERDFI